MKISDIIAVKKALTSVPLAAQQWMLTLFFLSTIIMGFAGGRHWFHNYLDKQEQSRRRDSIIIRSQALILREVKTVNMRVDSIASRQLLVNEKLNTVGVHIQSIENGNSTILYEFRRLEDLYSAFRQEPVAEKKNNGQNGLIQYQYKYAGHD